MCLGVPGKVVSVDGFIAQVDFWGVTRQVRLELCDADVEVGDYVLNHVGYAIRRIPPEEVEETLALYDELLEAAARGDGVDLLAADMRGELDATGGGGS